MTPQTELEIAHAIRDVEDPLEFASEFREHVKAVVAKFEQLGYVIVPKEPTEPMLNAARDWSAQKYGKPVGNDGAIGCYRSMIAAST